jgi:hypothetical protein
MPETDLLDTERRQIVQLAPADAVARLRRTPGQGRGFLGLDPVTQNDALLKILLARCGAQLFGSDVFGSDDAVLGYVPNADNQRQGFIATTSADPAVLAAFTEFLRVYRRYTSFVCHVADGDPAITALEGCGFRVAGRLRGHVFRTGAYHDVNVYFGRGES